MLNEKAQQIIAKAIQREKSRARVAAFYGIPPDLVEWYLIGKDCGPLTARCVIRVEMARKRALIEGRPNFWPQAADRYKGLR